MKYLLALIVAGSIAAHADLDNAGIEAGNALYAQLTKAVPPANSLADTSGQIAIMKEAMKDIEMQQKMQQIAHDEAMAVIPTYPNR